jgi:hypothetical protein
MTDGNGTVDLGLGSLAARNVEGFLTAYSASGAPLWTQRLVGSNPGGVVRAQATASDSNGDIFAVINADQSDGVSMGGGVKLCSLGGSTIFETNAGIAKYVGSSGVHLWSTCLTGEILRTVATTTTAQGDLITVGYAGGTVNFGLGNVQGPSVYDGIAPFMMKTRGSDGVTLWAKFFTTGTGNVMFSGVTMAPDGDIVLTGSSTWNSTASLGGRTVGGNAGGNDAFVARFDSSGNTVRWARTLASPSGDQPGGIAVDANGDVYLSMTFGQSFSIDGQPPLTSIGGSDIVILKLRGSDGTVTLQRQIGASGSDIVGITEEGVGFPSEGFGAFQYPAASTGLGLSPSGDIYVMGRYQSPSLTIAGTTLPNNNNSIQVFVTRMRPDGSYAWVRSYGTLNGNEQPAGFHVGPDGSLGVVGEFRYSQTSVWDSITLTNPYTNNGKTGFVVRLQP